MSWRIHLTNQAIQNLDILPGKPSLLAVWTRSNHVHYYNLETGVSMGDHTLPTAPAGDRSTEAWQTFVSELHPPDSSTFLPYVQTAGIDIYSSDDGKLRLYRTGDTDLYLETNGKEVKLPVEKADNFRDLDLDRALGVVAALDEDNHLHLYQQDIRIGRFDINLKSEPDLRPAVVISKGGGGVFATDGHRLIRADTSGEILKSLETHYFVGQIACSPGGGMLVTSDMEAGVLRVYNGKDLTPTHQRFAIDLIAAANQVQLLADLPPIGVALSALNAHNKGQLAFAMSGVVCATDVSHMDELPRPQSLL